jgi:hypothetical protein
MGGGLMQLVAYGAQDIYLTGNPQITFFKVVYRRHTNFSMESIEQTFNGTVAPCSRVSCTVSRNGDLIHKMYLRVSHSAANCECGASGVPTSSRGQAVGSPIPVIPDALGGHADGNSDDDISVCANDLIDSVEIEIGGQKIDKHYGDWLNIWTELSTPASKNAGLEELLNLKKGKFSYVPLQFWFCRNPGLALPLIALQYHEVKLNIEFSKSKSGGSCTGAMCELTPDSSNWDSASLWVDYIYLDTDERRRFAQVSHEYLIEQLQFTGTETLASSGSKSVRLNFNHPVKELVWRATGMVARGDTDRRVDLSNNPIVGYRDESVVTTRFVTDDTLSDNMNIYHGTRIQSETTAPTWAGRVINIETSAGVQKTGPVASGDSITIEHVSVGGAGTVALVATNDDVHICKEGGAAGVDSGLDVVSAVVKYQTISKPVFKYSMATTVSGLDATSGASVCASMQWSDVTLQLNGHERFSERHSEYFRLVQPLQHHTSIPVDSGIHVYSFALKPEEHQPSGTCNFSRIDNAVLKLTGMGPAAGQLAEDGIQSMSGATLRVYAVNYNVLRIMSGMGGLAYSN